MDEGLIQAAGGYAAVVLGLLGYIWKSHKSRIQELEDTVKGKASIADVQKLADRFQMTALASDMKDRLAAVQSHVDKVDARQIEDVKALRNDINGLASRLVESIEDKHAHLNTRMDDMMKLLMSVVREK